MVTICILPESTWFWMVTFCMVPVKYLVLDGNWLLTSDMSCYIFLLRMIKSHKLMFLRCLSHSVPESLTIKMKKTHFFSQDIQKHVTNNRDARNTYHDHKPHLRKPTCRDLSLPARHKSHMPNTQGAGSLIRVHISRPWIRDEIRTV